MNYELFESGSAPGTFFTIETWTGPADMTAHLETADVAASFAVTDGHLASAPAIHPLTPVAQRLARPSAPGVRGRCW